MTCDWYWVWVLFVWMSAAEKSPHSFGAAKAINWSFKLVETSGDASMRSIHFEREMDSDFDVCLSCAFQSIAVMPITLRPLMNGDYYTGNE